MALEPLAPRARRRQRGSPCGVKLRATDEARRLAPAWSEPRFLVSGRLTGNSTPTTLADTGPPGDALPPVAWSSGSWFAETRPDCHRLLRACLPSSWSQGTSPGMTPIRLWRSSAAPPPRGGLPIDGCRASPTRQPRPSRWRSAMVPMNRLLVCLSIAPLLGGLAAARSRDSAFLSVASCIKNRTFGFKDGELRIYCRIDHPNSPEGPADRSAAPSTPVDLLLASGSAARGPRESPSSPTQAIETLLPRPSLPSRRPAGVSCRGPALRDLLLGSRAPPAPPCRTPLPEDGA